MQQTNPEINTSTEMTNEEFDRYFDSKGEEIPERLLEAAEPPSLEPTAPEPEPAKEALPVAPEPEMDIKRLTGAMHEERERRKEYQRQLQQQEQELNQTRHQLQQVVEHLRQSQAPKEPTFDEDPLGALAHQQERIRQAVEYQQAIEAQRMQAQQMQQQMQHFQERYVGDARQFIQQSPDFKEAYNFLFQNRMDELTNLGYNQQQAQQILIEDEMASVSKAYQDGVNPAERLYKVAKLRGYKTKAAEQPKAQDTIKELAKAKESAVSLSNSNSTKADPNVLTPQAMLAMDDEEFDKLTPAQWKKVFGG